MHVLEDLASREWFQSAFALQVWAQKEFHRRACEVAGAGQLTPEPARGCLQIERNFFSTFFLAVTARAAGGSRYLPLYAMVNQAMRAWVTACDNLLDDEYKEIFPFTMAGSGDRMRSVLTLLIADRVVAEYATDTFADAALSRLVGRSSLAALMSSAVQESQEESRPVPVLPPARILNDIHQRKTGDLFMAPLALPAAMEDIPGPRLQLARTAACRFGLACQVLDDLKDMPDDLQAGRHNLLVSLLGAGAEGHGPGVEQLRKEAPGDWRAWERFPRACQEAWRLADERFAASFDALETLGVALTADQREGIVKLMGHLLGVPAGTVGAGRRTCV